jgi:hypothetical protein
VNEQDDFSDVRKTAQFDQIEAAVEDMARILALYLKALLKNGIPYPTAEKLIIEYQARFAQKK